MSWPQAVLFDLDGTLIDSAPDIAAAVNGLLKGHGLGPLTYAQVISMIGNGTKKLTERAFAATSGPLSPAELRRDLYEAMIGIAATGRGPADQVASIGCSIKWRDAA